MNNCFQNIIISHDCYKEIIQFSNGALHIKYHDFTNNITNIYLKYCPSKSETYIKYKLEEGLFDFNHANSVLRADIFSILEH